MDYQEPFSTRIYESSINYLMINYLIARDIRKDLTSLLSNCDT